MGKHMPKIVRESRLERNLVLTAEERQDSFRQMMETALETAWEFAEE